MFDGKIINIGTEHIIAEIVSEPHKIDALLQLLRPMGIIEAVRSGGEKEINKRIIIIMETNFSIKKHWRCHNLL